MALFASEVETLRDDYENCTSDEEVVEEEEADMGPDKLDISEKQAMANLKAAGTEVTEECDKISVEKHSELICPKVDAMLDDIVRKLSMPYAPSDFQRVAVNALAQKKNVILVSPTGSGKLNVPLLTSLVLRKQLNNANGITIITQPLTSIMNEKKKNDVCPIAVLSIWNLEFEYSYFEN